MRCKEGYRDECCCECEYQLEITVCDCQKCSKVSGYICILFHIAERGYQCTYSIDKHGICECFVQRKQPIKRHSADT